MSNFYGVPNQMQGYANPYYPQQQMQQPRQVEPVQAYVQPQQTIYNKPVSTLQGKLAESIDVIKATEVSFDGSISYFPLTDGSAIITKQLQPDGTTKMVMYKPIEQEQPEITNYITSEQLDEAIKNIDIKDYSKELKELNKKIDELTKKVEKRKEK